MRFTRSISLTNFIIASSALAFQITVLYPWHKKLDDKFEKLHEEQLASIRASEIKRDAVLGRFRREMEVEIEGLRAGKGRSG